MKTNHHADQAGHDELYRGRLSDLAVCTSPDDFVAAFRASRIAPFHCGGPTKGYVRGLAVSRLLAAADQSGAQTAEASHRHTLTVLDAGSGQGELSVFLAASGFNVIGIDISAEAQRNSQILAERVGVLDRCCFKAESLESTSLPTDSIDFIIGIASLHHFIKYPRVPTEFRRIMKTGAKGFFADSFGENPVYRIFHNRDLMKRLGDVVLTKDLINSYFETLAPLITPTDWLVMLDKLYLRLVPGAARAWRELSRGPLLSRPAGPSNHTGGTVSIGGGGHRDHESRRLVGQVDSGESATQNSGSAIATARSQIPKAEAQRQRRKQADRAGRTSQLLGPGEVSAKSLALIPPQPVPVDHLARVKLCASVDQTLQARRCLVQEVD